MMFVSFGKLGSGLFSSLAAGAHSQSWLVLSVEIGNALSLRIGERSRCLFGCRMCLSRYHSQLPVKLVAVTQKSGHAISG